MPSSDSTQPLESNRPISESTAKAPLPVENRISKIKYFRSLAFNTVFQLNILAVFLDAVFNSVLDPYSID